MRNLLLYIIDTASKLLMFLIFYIVRLLKAPIWWMKSKSFTEWYLDNNTNEQTNNMIVVLSLSLTTSILYIFGWLWLTIIILSFALIAFIYVLRTKSKYND
jgi:hypothetical protein